MQKMWQVAETIEHLIAGCSSLSESARLRRHNQSAKAIHQQTAKMRKLFDKNTPPYYRYKQEPVLESANVISYWGRSIITDTTADFNRHDIVLIDSENKTAHVIDTAVPLTHNLPKSEAEKITKYEKLGPGNQKYLEA